MSKEKMAGDAAGSGPPDPPTLGGHPPTPRRPAWFDASWDPEVPLVPADDLHPAAQAVMEPGETLLWTGRPSTVAGAFVKEAGDGLVPLLGAAVFSILFGVTVVVEPYLAGQPMGPALWERAVPLLFVGFLFCSSFGGLLGILWKALSIYAISDRRVLRLPRSGRVAMSSYEVDPLSVETIPRLDGSGDILFADEPWQASSGKASTRRTGFYRISRIRSVERLLLAAAVRRQAAAMSPSKRRRAAALTGLGRELRSHGVEGRASAVARLLYADESVMGSEIQARHSSARMVQALGVVGIWRPIGISGAQMLLRALGGSAQDYHAAAQAVVRLGSDAVACIVQAWAVEDAAGRSRLLSALAWVEPGLLAAALAQVLLGKEPASGIAVAQEVAHSRQLREPVIRAWLASGAAVVEPLLGLLQGEGRRARWWAAEALGTLASKGSADQAWASLDASNPPQAAVLAFQGDPAGLETLIPCLGGRDPDAIPVAAEALGRLGAAGAPALEALRDALSQLGEEHALAACRQALRRIQGALQDAPAELEASSAPAGTGTEPEAAPAPAGTGTEPEAASTWAGVGEPASASPPAERQKR